MPNCVNHPRVRSVTECSDCGDSLCSECVGFGSRAKTLCGACSFRAKQYRDVEIPPELEKLYPEYADPAPRPKPAPPPRPRPVRPPRPSVTTYQPKGRFQFQAPGMMLPLVAMVIVAAGYIGFELLFPDYAPAETSAMPAQELPGFGKFKECQLGLRRTLTAIETGSGEFHACPGSHLPYLIRREGELTLVECPRPADHGVKRLYIDTKRRLPLAER